MAYDDCKMWPTSGRQAGKGDPFMGETKETITTDFDGLADQVIGATVERVVVECWHEKGTSGEAEDHQVRIFTDKGEFVVTGVPLAWHPK